MVAGSFPAHRYPLFALPFRKPAATGQGFSHTALVSFCSLSIHRCSCLPSLQATENMTHVINYFLLLFGCQCFFFFIGLFLLSHQHCNSPFLMRQSQFMHLPGSLWILFLLILYILASGGLVNNTHGFRLTIQNYLIHHPHPHFQIK